MAHPEPLSGHPYRWRNRDGAAAARDADHRRLKISGSGARPEAFSGEVEVFPGSVLRIGRLLLVIPGREANYDAQLRI
jgi:hypothetical protein